MYDTRPKADEIVVGIDGSGGSLKALHWALEQAQATDSRVRAVCAWHRASEVGAFYAPAVMTPEEQEQWAHRTVDEAVAPYRGGPVEVIAETAEGPAWRVLVESARTARLLVVGSRGHGSLSGVLLGSVSQRCAAHARCPVVIVPPTE